MDAEIRQLDAIRDAAYGLAVEFAEAARAEGDLDRKLQLFDAFRHSGASVRLSIMLAMRLRREGRLAAPAEADVRGMERAEAPEPPDHTERPERHDERDRDRETERASLPILMRTLERVADDAETLLPQAAELPSLREILDRVRAQPASAPASPPTPSPAPAKPPSPLRARLSGGTAALTLAPPLGSGRPGLPGAAPRRSTGPP